MREAWKRLRLAIAVLRGQSVAYRVITASANVGIGIPPGTACARISDCHIIGTRTAFDFTWEPPADWERLPLQGMG